MSVTKLIALLVIGLGGSAFIGTSYAEETTGEKISGKASEINKDAKVKGRNMRKKMRDDEPMEDAKDTAKNARDEAEYKAKRLKDKAD